MSGTAIRVGLLDSGVGAALLPRMAASSAFRLDEDGQVQTVEVMPDAILHGDPVAQILLSAAPAIALYNAQVFTQTNSTHPATIAAGLDWLLAQDVAIVNMSFGLRQNRAVLRQACATAIAAGLILVAAAPARGQAVYPSAYPGVLRVTGDARCALQEFSHLASEQADFGACPRSYAQPEHGAPVGGASFAVPHVSAALARYLAAGGKASDYYQHLTELAVYHGPERRR